MDKQGALGDAEGALNVLSIFLCLVPGVKNVRRSYIAPCVR